jgi:branched-chain amino acid transport system substrate-binding protein
LKDLIPFFTALIRIKDWVAQLISLGEWSTLLVFTDILLALLFMPKEGIFYDSLSRFLPEQYIIFFLSAEAILFVVAVLLKRFDLDRPIRVSKQWKKILIGLVSIIALIFLMRLWPNNLESQNTVKDKLSWGEELLMPENKECKGISGAENFKESDFKKAEKSYEQYIKNCKNATEEGYIYFNNSKAIQNKNPIKIAVAVPISRENGSNISREILKGVALAQDEWNNKYKDTDLALIGIADDGDSSDEYCGENHDAGECKKAIKIAEKLATQKDILGVIGPFSSDPVEAVAKIYEKEQLVSISPGSTAKRIENSKADKCPIENGLLCLNQYIFRTAPNDSESIKKLIKYINKASIKTITIIYESQNKYSNLFKRIFAEKFVNKSGGKVTNTKPDVCDFALHSSFDVQKCLDNAKKAGSEALLMLPSTRNASDVEKVLSLNANTSYGFDLLGADSMYNEIFVMGKMKPNTKGMKIIVPWQRDDDICDETKNSPRLECQAFRLFKDSDEVRPKPLQISWITKTSYDATKILLRGIEQTSDQKCGFKIFNFSIFDHNNTCLRKELKNVLLSIETEDNLLGEKNFFDDNGDRIPNKEIGVIVEPNKNTYKKVNLQDGTPKQQSGQQY